MSSSTLNNIITLCNLPVLLFRYTTTSKNQYRHLQGLNTRICTNHQLLVSPLHNRAPRMFDYTSYFVTVGLSNKVHLRLLGNYSVMLEPLESLLCCLARHFFLLIFPFISPLLFPPFSLLLSSSFLSGCNKDVLFNLRVSSLTETGLYKDAINSNFWKV